MELITTTSELAAACTRLAKHWVITVDTEFLRETTYYPLLCVVQMASPDEAVVIDALADGIDLAPFFALMANEGVNMSLLFGAVSFMVGAFGGLVWILSAEKAAQGSTPIEVPDNAV